MSKAQLEAIDQEIRQRPRPVGLTMDEARAGFAERMAANDGLPMPTVEADVLGGVPIARIGDETAEEVVFYLHGGTYMLGTAANTARLPGAIGARAGARVISVDYRLAPEHPFPAGLDDALAAYRALLDGGATRIAFAGDSAGGGLVLATLLAARDAGLPLPSSAVLFSPWTDLTLSGASMTERSALDPTLTKDGLAGGVAAYRGSADPANPLLSPAFAELRGLPPLMVVVGGNEILLDDSLQLAARAASYDVPVRLEVTPGASHVFPLFGKRLDEAEVALRHVGEFLGERFACCGNK
ncbi:MAG TPA: alpha/beta hydrolase [Pseudonocardiaceae bacterium]